MSGNAPTPRRRAEQLVVDPEQVTIQWGGFTLRGYRANAAEMVIEPDPFVVEQLESIGGRS